MLRVEDVSPQFPAPAAPTIIDSFPFGTISPNKSSVSKMALDRVLYHKKRKLRHQSRSRPSETGLIRNSGGLEGVSK